MDTTNFEYRLIQLEQERLPSRMQAVEITMGIVQGEVVAMKEIARGIGVKLDSGIEKLSTDSNIKMAELKLEQAQNMAFVKGVLWVAGIVGATIAAGPVIGEVFKRLTGV